MEIKKNMSFYILSFDQVNMLVLLVLISSGLVADAKLVPRVYNGEDAWIDEYPYQVSIEFEGHHVCGGSIISRHYVLTAAHCAGLVPDVDKLYIRAGTSFRGKDGSLHKVTKFIKHEGYDENRFFVNDIAIIEIKEPFHYDDAHKPIKMFENNEEVPAGAKSIVTGFGLVNATNLANQLQSVDLSIPKKQDCKKIRGNPLPEGQICAFGENGKDACTGDSGGPIAVDGRLAGIVSYGPPCGDSTHPSFYTEVAYYRDWIGRHIKFL